MELDIRAGKRVLYKHNNQWEVGRIARIRPSITEKGLYLFLIPKEFLNEDEEHVSYTHDAEINDIFLDATQIDDWMKDYKDIFMTKEEYLKFIESEEFSKATEQSYVSDGEYYYYPISKYTKGWIEKQPFDYVVRML